MTFLYFFQPPNGENVMNSSMGANRLASNQPPGSQSQQQQQQQQQPMLNRQNGPTPNGLPNNALPGAGTGGNIPPYIGEKLPMAQPPSNLGPQRDDGSSGYGSPDSETLEIPTAQ